MDFQYNFRQAHNDRLEDAGVKRYGYQNTDGYVFDNSDKPKRKSLPGRVKQLVIATVQLLVK